MKVSFKEYLLMTQKTNLKDFENGVLDIDFEGNRTLFSSIHTFIVSDLISNLKSILAYGLSQDEREAFFAEGVKCRLLKPGNDWQEGKLQISIHFIPDEVDSPLDDIRQAIADDSQPV